MITLHIDKLVGGNITITTGSSTPATRTATRVWYGNDENVYTDYEISGEISANWEEGPPMPTTQIPNVESAKKIEFGSTVTRIGDQAFFCCNDLTSVTIPNTLTSFGMGVFNSCQNLTNVNLPENMTSISHAMFQACQSLTDITIPASVTSIGAGAFSNCIGLTSVTFEGKDKSTVQGMTDYPFSLDTANPNGVTIHCTDGDIQIIGM